MKTPRALILALLPLLSGPVSAAVVSINLSGQGSPFDFEATTGTHTMFYNNLQLAFTSYVNDVPAGTLNGTSQGFGVNAPLSGDATYELDNDNGNGDVESVGIVFSVLSDSFLRSAKLDSFTLGNWGSGEQAAYKFYTGAEPGWTVITQSTPNESFTVPVHGSLDGYTLKVRYESGNGFSLNALDVDVVVLPEPTSLGLLLIGALGLRYGQRRRQKA